MNFEDRRNRHGVSRRNTLKATGTAALLLTGGGFVGSVGARGTPATDSEHGWASATIHDQVIDASRLREGGASVLVKRGFMESGGYMSIHDAPRRLELDGPVDDPINESFVGLTEYLEPGDYHDLEVPLYPNHIALPGDPRPWADDARDAVELNSDIEWMRGSQPLLAIPHVDGSSPRETFVVGEDGAYLEGKRTLNRLPPIHDIATIYFAGDARDEMKAAKDAERQARRVWNGRGR